MLAKTPPPKIKTKKKKLLKQKKQSKANYTGIAPVKNERILYEWINNSIFD